MSWESNRLVVTPSFSFALGMTGVVTRQTESRCPSVFNTVSFFFISGLGTWPSEYLCGGQEQGRSKFLLEKMLARHIRDE